MKIMARFLYLLGRPFYLLLESIIILSLLILYQIGQLFLRRLPFLGVFLFLGIKFIILKLKYYFLRFAQKPRLVYPPTFFAQFREKLKLLPLYLQRLTQAAKGKLPPYRRPKVFFPRLRLRVRLAGGVIALLAVLLFSFWFYILRDLPKPEELISRPSPLTTRILDRSGQLLYKIYRSQNRTRLVLSDVPLHLQQATVAIEDAEFYTHPGFSLRGILRAIERNVIRGELTGGSTITQQLVKNKLLTPEKTLRRKFKEITLAFLTELKFSKNEILEMYLNEISYGGAAYGLEEAAQLYFGKPAQNLTLGEAALLAGLPAAPTRFSPFGANPEEAFAQQKIVLKRMVEENFITPEQAIHAQEEKPVFALQRIEIKAPHFVMYVRQLLVERYGEQRVTEGGLTIVTSLDLKIQEETERIVREEVVGLSRLRVGNGAALVMNPGTGEILTMVGSANYFNQREGNFNVTLASRQPGSSIKPVNYAWALSHGYTPATIIDDSPVTYNIPGQPPYSPDNYDRAFRGNVPLRIALGSSLNVPAVKVLASYGVSNMIEQGKKMGITTWEDPSRFGLSLTLGGGEIKMTDLSVVYATLANYGKKVELVPILKVTDSAGQILEENGCEYCGEQVLDERVAFLLTDILRDNSARTPAFGTNSLLVIPEHPEVAVKTGTTQNLRDNWAIGYTKDYVVAAWVGNNDNTPMSYVASGVTGATPIWHKIMKNLLEGKPNNPPAGGWETPPGIVKIPICSATGTLPCEGCPQVREEYFLEENQPKTACNLQPSPQPQ